MDSRTWLADLEQFGIKLGLDTIRAILEDLGHPERTAPVIHIGGTNGKGSVAAMVAHGLASGGIRTGRYTSPHLLRLEERFAIDGTPVSSRELDAALDRVRDVVAGLQRRGALAVQPTYFEATTAAAFLLFASAAVQASVIEVGLGGRFDATNVVVPDVVAITSVDFDHQAQLGDTLASIAAEKAGIVKSGAALVVGPLSPDARGVVERAAAAAGVTPIHVSDSSVHVRPRAGRYEVVIRTPAAEYGPLLLALAGRHQVQNALVAVRVLEAWQARGHTLPRDAVVRGLTEARWPGRLDWIETLRGRVLIDGAHNPAGARALASYLAEAGTGALPIVFGAMRDKDAVGMIAPLAPVARPLIVTRAPGRRAEDPERLRAFAAEAGIDAVVEESLDAALDRAWSHRDAICVAGSLYLAGAAMDALGVGSERRQE